MYLGNRMRGMLIAAAAFLATAAPTTLRAQAPDAGAGAPDKPVVVVSITNIDRLIQDVNYVSGAVGQAQTGGIFAMMAGNFTNGLDRTRPLGVAVTMVDGAPAPIVFLPTTDIKRFLKSLEAQLGPADELDDGTLAVAVQNNILYIRQQGDWAYGAQSQELLKGLPANPLTWLDGMGEKYDIGVRLNVQSFTPEQRQMFIDQLRQGFEQALAQQPPEQAEQVRRMGGSSLEQLELMINDTDVLQFGFAIEPQQRRLRFEMVGTAAAGTDLAKMYDAQQAIPSKFASVIRPDAAVYIHSASSIGTEGIEQAKTSLEQVSASLGVMLEDAENLSPADREELEAFLQRLIDIGVETIEEGKSDAGFLVTLDNQQFNAVGGFFVSDGGKITQLVKDLAAKLENEPNAPKFTFDASTHKGVSFHYVDIAIPEDEDETRQIFGEQLRIVLGTGPDAAYVALGQQGESMLKSLIDQAGGDAPASDRPLGQGKIALLPILQFAHAIEPQDGLAAAIDALSRAGDTDNIDFVSQSIEHGVTMEINIGEGILRAIGAVIQAQQQQAQF